MVPRQLKKLHTLWLCLAVALPGLGLLGGNVRGRQQSQSHGSSEKQPLVGPRKEGSLNTHCTPAGESVNSGFHTTRKRGTAVILVFQMGSRDSVQGSQFPS